MTYILFCFLGVYCLVPLWKGYTKRALKEVHFFTKVLYLYYVHIVRLFKHCMVIIRHFVHRRTSDIAILAGLSHIFSELTRDVNF